MFGRGSERRRYDRRADAPRAQDARIADVAGRSGAPIDEVMREVADYRLALETDLIIAAAAVDAREEGLACEVLAGEQDELARFSRRLMQRLEGSVRPPAPRRVPAGRARLVAAAAAVLAITSGAAVLRSPERLPASHVALDEADRQFGALSRAATNQQPHEVAAAAAELNETLAGLVADHAGDPEVAAQIALLIADEQTLLRASNVAGVNVALAAVRELKAALIRRLPAKLRATMVPLLDGSAQPRSTSARPSPRPSPKPSASASPRPSPRPSPSPSASPAPSSSSSNPLPTGSPVP